MINFTHEQKQKFFTSGNFFDYQFYFPGIGNDGYTVDNDILAQESVTFSETILDAEELVLGGCIASSCEFELLEAPTEELTKKNFTATLIINEGKPDAFSVSMGKYYVDSAPLVNDDENRRVTAYDALYKLSRKVRTWYRKTMFPTGNEQYTLKEFREALLNEFKIPFREATYPNDDVIIRKTVKGGGLTGAYVLKCICTLNCGFGKIDRGGYFVVQQINPEQTYDNPEDFEFLYGPEPDDKLRPDCIENKIQEITANAPTCILIESGESDFQYGDDDSNPYIMSDNFLLYKKTNDELDRICQPIALALTKISYRPCELTCQGLPYLETGDKYTLIKNGVRIENYVFSRKLSGVQGLRDNFSSQGYETRQNEYSANSESNNIRNEIENGDIVGTANIAFQTYTNPSVYTVKSNSELEIIHMNIAASENGTVLFTAIIPYRMSLDGEITFKYYYDGVLQNGDDVTEYHNRGAGVTTLVKPVSLGSDGKLILSVKAKTAYFESDSRKHDAKIAGLIAYTSTKTYTEQAVDTTAPKATINNFAIKAVVIGADLKSMNEWDGRITIGDDFHIISITPNEPEINIAGFSENVECEFTELTRQFIEEIFDKIQIEPYVPEISITPLLETADMNKLTHEQYVSTADTYGMTGLEYVSTKNNRFEIKTEYEYTGTTEFIDEGLCMELSLPLYQFSTVEGIEVVG